MLHIETIKKIEEFVYKKPCSIQEVATLLQKNWRTADRYVQEIEQEFGTLATKTFREGTRGALKIVYWAAIEKVSHSIFQKAIEADIGKTKWKKDFSAFDIYQHIQDKYKQGRLETAKHEGDTYLQELADLLAAAQKQVLVFSGNASFVNLKNKDVDIFHLLEQLVKRGVTIKVLSRVDIAGKENVEKILSLNFKHGKDNIEVRHDEHPLRGFIIDKKILRLKEAKEPTGRIKELNKKTFLYYTIKEKAWIEWLAQLFWKRFSNSIGAQRRLEELRKLV